MPVQIKLAKQLFDRGWTRRGGRGGSGRNVSFNLPVAKACRYFVVTDSNNHHPILKVGGGIGGVGGLGRGGDFTPSLTDHICSWIEPLARNQRKPFGFGSGNQAADWIMMPFLIRLFPLQDIAPPLLLSIIQYLTRGDFTEFQRRDDYVISCDTLI